MAKGGTAEDFRKKYDQSYIVPEKIKAGLTQLGDSWMDEKDFVKLAGISHNQMSRYREQFAEFYIETPRVGSARSVRAWAGTKKFAAKLRANLASN